eukprot:CAMPEP_0184327032 /NCGR_PEP_ID=MMETSP1049-20130417/142881_1 /TAXON_ID=77928 /ORGANISM="Proteomonas sulcata, Strain CCMP704" /LENGTH=140 /DNA_ID=CAMNT_0026649267 /DNA_START=405 /DNA_END=828 /DNA_ORIENTATION=-
MYAANDESKMGEWDKAQQFICGLAEGMVENGVRWNLLLSFQQEPVSAAVCDPASGKHCLRDSGLSVAVSRVPELHEQPLTQFGDAEGLLLPQQFSGLWNITGTRIHLKARSSEPWAQGSMIPGSNYSAQDDHAGVQVPGL